MDAEIPQRFSDEQAKAILARAIEIDSRSPMTTMDDLREIASEIGVSPASLQAALYEQATTREARRDTVMRRAGIAITGIGLPIGVAAGLLLGSVGVMAGVGVSALGLVATAGLLLLQRADGSLRSFHVRNAALWLGIGVGSVTAMLLVPGDPRLTLLVAVAWSIKSWIASSVLGTAAVVAIRRAHGDGRSGGGPGAEGAIPERPNPLRRLARRVIAWIGRPLQQRTQWQSLVGTLRLSTRSLLDASR